MVRRFRLLIAAAIAVSLSLSFAVESAAATADCSTSDWLSGGCSVSGHNDGTEVTLEGTATGPGGGSGANGGSGGSGVGSAGSGGSGAPVEPVVVRDNYTVTMPVTLGDLARFRPNAGVDYMQPNGWMIVGLSTNFFARAEQHIKSGTLLGGPAFVRFTPVRYSWTYGDGSSATTSTPGATWAALGVSEFEVTATSHIYRAPGRYLIDLTIGYAPEYRLAASATWIPVSGLVWVPANQLEAVASAGAKTVLVENECTINASGPGC